MHTSNFAPSIYCGSKWPHFLSARNAVGRDNRFCILQQFYREKTSWDIRIRYAHFVLSDCIKCQLSLVSPPRSDPVGRDSGVRGDSTQRLPTGRIRKRMKVMHLSPVSASIAGRLTFRSVHMSASWIFSRDGQIRCLWGLSCGDESPPSGINGWSSGGVWGEAPISRRQVVKIRHK